MSHKESIKKIINKKNKSKIVCLTSYSKNIAQIIDDHADIILVGDSLGTVLYNYNTTRKVDLKMIIEHSKSVRMGVKKSLLVIDLPYNTYRNKSEALKNSKKAIKVTDLFGRENSLFIHDGCKIYKESNVGTDFVYNRYYLYNFTIYCVTKRDIA